MSPRARGRLAWGVFGLGVAIFASDLVLQFANGASSDDPLALPFSILGFLGYAGVGALIASRSGNPIGWIMLVMGSVFIGTLGLAEEYARAGIQISPDSLPFPTFAAWVASWGLIPLLEGIPLLLLLFPTGSPPSARWRPLAWAIGALTLVGVLGGAFSPNPLTGGNVRIANPFAVSPLRDVSGPMLLICGVGSLIAFVFAVVSLTWRFRRSAGEERAQIRWLAYAGVLGLGSIALLIVLGIAGVESGPVPDFLFWFTAAVAAIGIPIACGVAVLRYHLYDIDVVIRKTVVYAVLAGFVAIVYAAVVAGLSQLIGGSSLLLSILATAIVAALFHPVREWATRFANRIVFGRRAEPYEVLARFSERVGETYAAEDVLPRMARVIAEGCGAERVEVLVRHGDRMRQGASWPADQGPLHQADRSAPITHQGEILGEIRVRKPAGEPLTVAEAKLLGDLASQAGVLLRNVGLTAELQARVQELSDRAAELRASRVRIVAAHDAERRRLERNIHDGAQQHLVALAVKLRLASALAAKDPPKAGRMLRELSDQTERARTTLLDLARGIYPPTLEERGIAAALQEQASAAGAPVTVETDGDERLSIETEAAVYFVCLEAIQNAAKYARASTVNVRLSREDGRLTFEVVDNGIGFHAETAASGSGLQNMRDRLSVLGGTVEITSKLGVGTTVRGAVPVLEEVRV